jgi:F0F1-type ATP synthase beta subunit
MAIWLWKMIIKRKEVLQDAKELQNIINRYGIITERSFDRTKMKKFHSQNTNLTKQISVMETTTNYNENNAYIGQKSGRIERVLWKPDFVLFVIPFLIL